MRIDQQNWFSKISRPSRYLGEEVNSIRKEPEDVDVTVALVFPEVYEIGMSHLGLKILYHILNSEEWLSAERFFAPWVDLESELRSRHIFPASLESGRPLTEFDIVGFSLQHELCYTNILSILDLAGIPFLSMRRQSASPLIIAGGPSCFNPEPVADLFDAIVVGDGEETGLQICRALREWKLTGGQGRETLLRELSKIRGVYVPSFFKVNYQSSGRIGEVEPLVEGYVKVRKAIVPDLDRFPFPVRQIIPFSELVHDRFTIEICRGCTRGCRFCQAGMIYRPVRERNPQGILEAAEKGLQKTGFEDLSLLSLSAGDYSCIMSLLEELSARLEREHVGVSLSSLHVDKVISSLMEEMKGLRKAGFTIAPEAGSQRLRNAINKRLTDDQILSTTREIYQSGLNLIKLYFMVGLPGEEDSDLISIVELSKKIAGLAPRGRKGNVLNVSLAPFVPKAHTPFEWLPQLDLGESNRRVAFIRERVQNPRIRVKWNKPEASWLEGIFSRGDRRLSRVLIEAWKMGARFDGWNERLDLEIWRRAFQEQDLDPAFYLFRERPYDEIQPWDHIDSGVRKEFLLGELKKARSGETTDDCRDHCLGCGVCSEANITPILFTEFNSLPGRRERTNVKSGREEVVRKYRLCYTKANKARHLSHLELNKVFIRAFRRCGLELAYSGGYHPMPKLSFALALPVGIESLSEFMDISVINLRDLPGVVERLNRELPSGIKILAMQEVSAGTPSLDVKESHFQIQSGRAGFFRQQDIDRFLRSEEFKVIRRRKDTEREIDIRPQVKEMALVPEGGLKLVLRHRNGPQMKPAEIIGAVFSLPEGETEEIKILKTTSVLR